VRQLGRLSGEHRRTGNIVTRTGGGIWVGGGGGAEVLPRDLTVALEELALLSDVMEKGRDTELSLHLYFQVPHTSPPHSAGHRKEAATFFQLAVQLNH